MQKKFKADEFSTLTSCDVITEQHNEFKKIAKLRKFSQQKLLNRSIYLYLNDESFRSKLENCFELKISGSQF